MSTITIILTVATVLVIGATIVTMIKSNKK
ncbi:Uncharacterised protein [Lysinibacillus capsici]|uniref:Uncharacterized protein n=1 Tax=Lysinibacillus capsici TaxID=2115968 RepID=A0A2X0Z9I2_9BACI|nr:Uncharacterised protein [Lysinibacillus capsici]